MQTLARGSAAVLRGTQFNGKTYHMDHVVCCPAVSLEPFSTAPLNADARPGEGCVAWTAPPADRLEFADDRLRSSLKRGDVCIAQYMAGAAWTQTRDFLQKAVEMGLAPDLLAVDSGLGYKDHDDGGVSRAFDAWLDVTAPHLATNGTHLVVVTPTHNPFYGWLNPLAPTQNEFRSSWRSETATYEHIRETIALLPPEVRRHGRCRNRQSRCLLNGSECSWWGMGPCNALEGRHRHRFYQNSKQLRFCQFLTHWLISTQG